MVEPEVPGVLVVAVRVMCVKAAHRWVTVSLSLVEGAVVILAARTTEQVAKAAVCRVTTARTTMGAILLVVEEHRTPVAKLEAVAVPERLGKVQAMMGTTRPAAVVDTTVAAVLTRLVAVEDPAT